MVHIFSLDDPRIVAYRYLRSTPPQHSEQRIFVTEGLTSTKKLLQSDLDVVSMFALPVQLSSQQQGIRDIEYSLNVAASTAILLYEATKRLPKT